MSLLIDDVTVVGDFEELNWNREANGLLQARHLYTHVLRSANGWADVLIVLAEKERNIYTLTKWKKMGPAWHLRDKFRVREDTLQILTTLASPLFLATAERREDATKWPVKPPPSISFEG